MKQRKDADAARADFYVQVHISSCATTHPKGSTVWSWATATLAPALVGALVILAISQGPTPKPPQFPTSPFYHKQIQELGLLDPPSRPMRGEILLKNRSWI